MSKNRRAHEPTQPPAPEAGQPSPYSADDAPAEHDETTPPVEPPTIDPVRELAERLFVAIHSRGTPADAVTTARVAIIAARAFDAAWGAQ